MVFDKASPTPDKLPSPTIITNNREIFILESSSRNKINNWINDRF